MTEQEIIDRAGARVQLSKAYLSLTETIRISVKTALEATPPVVSPSREAEGVSEADAQFLHSHASTAPFLADETRLRLRAIASALRAPVTVKKLSIPAVPGTVEHEAAVREQDRYGMSMDGLASALAKTEAAERSLRNQLTDYEEREAACCPEDIGFDEYISTLERRLGEAEDRATRAEAGARDTADWCKQAEDAMKAAQRERDALRPNAERYAQQQRDLAKTGQVLFFVPSVPEFRLGTAC